MLIRKLIVAITGARGVQLGKKFVDYLAPPMIGYYSESSSLEDMEKFIIGK